jgi:hypothetical protein
MARVSLKSLQGTTGVEPVAEKDIGVLLGTVSVVAWKYYTRDAVDWMCTRPA